MSVAAPSRPRVVVDGKFFRLGEKKFFVKGIAYGPFAPNAQGLPFAAPEQTARDFDQIRELGANVVRLYDVPPRWLLDLAEARGLKLLVDIPWNKHLCFDSDSRRNDAREAVRRALHACGRHPAVFAFSVANEIPADIARWSGPKAVAALIDDLVAEAKRIDPECLCTYANFPPTEFLRPRNLDFFTFNVYLHQEQPFRNYLARLQMLAESKPLILGEFGMDSLREGERAKSEFLTWQIENAFRGGLAGAVVFAYTDEWFRDGRPVDDWQMGLVTAERQPKDSFRAVQKMFALAPRFPLPRTPRVSVVVASYNGDRTLKACLDSLKRLNYPDYEVILVDDGSTDNTPRIVEQFRQDGWGERSPGAPAAANLPPDLICLRHEKNFGLSAARNTGITAARGEIVAFTDADCRADEDWLYYLVAALLDREFVGVGGPNLLPPEDSPVAAAVMVSPGGPTHVMLTDRQAEHIPGCNMGFYKWVLEDIGGFDPIFVKAGDDVDVCWRVQQAGHTIGFSPAAFVWHYRRSTIGAYLKQQEGYGAAEAMLVRKHPENFNWFGAGVWRGRIYTGSRFGVELRAPVIYHGLFGSAGFQRLYASEPATMLMLSTTPEYHLFVTLPLWILSTVFPYLLPLAIVSLAIPVSVCVAASAQAALPKNKTEWWSRLLVAVLFFLQPIFRGLARYQERFAVRPTTPAARESLDSVALRNSSEPLKEVAYWSERRLDRLAFVASIFERLQRESWPARPDSGWSDYDAEIHGSRWNHLQLTTVAEDHPRGRQLIRSRLRTTWSLTARIALAAVAGLELLLIGWAHSWWPWSWFLLLTLPFGVWLLLRDGRNLRSILVVLLDALAREQGLVKVSSPSAPPPGVQANPPPPAA